MAAQYQMRVYDTHGVQVAVFDDWNSLYIYNRINDYGYHTISIQGDDPRRALFVIDCTVEVWRSNPDAGIPWRIEYAAFHRTSQDQVTDRGLSLFTSYGRTYEDLLHRRVILYPAGTLQDTWSGTADDVVKGIVIANVAGGATIGNGRFVDGVTPGFSSDPGFEQASHWEGSVAFKNVLDQVKAIQAAVPEFDFGVERTGPQTFRFKTYFPRKGTNRSILAPGFSPHVFSLGHGNMSSPYATESHSDEANEIVVLGAGEGTDRQFEIRQRIPAQILSPWNKVERTYDQRNVTTQAGLQASGDAQLKSLAATQQIAFQAIESAGSLYGRDYFLGDLVLCQFAGLEAAKKIVGVEITVAQGKEDIRVHFDDEQ